jgi:hypothetical protein
VRHEIIVFLPRKKIGKNVKYWHKNHGKMSGIYVKILGKV